MSKPVHIFRQFFPSMGNNYMISGINWPDPSICALAVAEGICEMKRAEQSGFRPDQIDLHALSDRIAQQLQVKRRPDTCTLEIAGC